MRIKAETDVAVVDRAGAWALIWTETGWQAWVDGSRLDEAANPTGAPRAAETPAPPPPE